MLKLDVVDLWSYYRGLHRSYVHDNGRGSGFITAEKIIVIS